MALTTEEIQARFRFAGTNTGPVWGGTSVASATSIDLSPDNVAYPIVDVTGTTDIANIKPPYVGFQGTIRFRFAGGSPPDFVSGGSPAAGYFAVALTKSMAQFEVVELTLLGSLWYPNMT